MAKKSKINWSFGDIFLIPLKNGSFGIGQILDLQMTNVVRCAIFNETKLESNNYELDDFCKINNLVSLIACTKEQLDFGIWKIIGNKNIEINKIDFPNEKFRDSNWIGSKVYDASIVEDFINAYHSLSFWDDWADPNYFDKFLINPSIKPKRLLLVKDQ